MLEWSFFWTIYYKESEHISNHYQKIQNIFCPRLSLQYNYLVISNLYIELKNERRLNDKLLTVDLDHGSCGAGSWLSSRHAELRVHTQVLTLINRN